jgi:hypothetical protein
MRGRFEFLLHRTNPGQSPAIDATLALLGSQGWEIRGLASRDDGSVIVALQRPLDEESPLAASSAIAATLEAPLLAPGPSELAAHPGMAPEGSALERGNSPE